jgi:polysaccharide biosynthesis protein PslH
MLRELKKDHHITYLTLDDGSGGPTAHDKAFEYAHDIITVPHQTSTKFSFKFYLELILNLVSGMPYALQKYVSVEMRHKVSSLAVSKNFDILICDFLASAVNLPSAINIPTLLFQHNVEAMIWRRHFEVAENRFQKSYLKMQWKRMIEYERKLCKNVDWIVAVSKHDAETIQRAYDVRSISHVGTGVDVDYFSQDPDDISKGPEIVFTGSMDWLPNDDAVRWFLSEILPRIQERLPEASFSIVGREPSRSLVEYSRSKKGVTITGTVPDVRPYLSNAKTYVVPIRIGGGTRLKIYEAMAMGLPVVSTSVGAEGLPVNDGEGIIIRDSPGDFADAVIELLRDSDRARDIGLAGARVVRSKYGWDKIIADFSAACTATVEQYAARNEHSNGRRDREVPRFSNQD